MKLSIGFFAAVSANNPSKSCNDYVAISPDFFNCWNPSGHFESQNSTEGFIQTNPGGECGFDYLAGNSLDAVDADDFSIVNKTCSFVPADVDGSYVVTNAVFVAKGAAGPNQIVGFEGITGNFEYIQKWDVEFNWELDFNTKLGEYVAAVDEANKQNTTLPEPFSYDRVYDCAAEIGAFVPPSEANCQDNGAPYTDYAIMFTNQHAGDENNNYAIANYQIADTFTVQINKPCQKWGFTPHDQNQGTIDFVVRNENECTFTVTLGPNTAAQLFYFQGSIDEGVIDFFDDITIA